MTAVEASDLGDEYAAAWAESEAEVEVWDSTLADGIDQTDPMA